MVSLNQQAQMASDNPDGAKDKANTKITVSLAYAPTATKQLYKTIKVVKGATIFDALSQSGWLDTDSELATWCQAHKQAQNINKKSWRVGVYSQKKPLSHVLNHNERIEVYRPLTIDPQSRRKSRADS